MQDPLTPGTTTRPSFDDSDGGLMSHDTSATDRVLRGGRPSGGVNNSGGGGESKRRPLQQPPPGKGGANSNAGTGNTNPPNKRSSSDASHLTSSTKSNTFSQSSGGSSGNNDNVGRAQQSQQSQQQQQQPHQSMRMQRSRSRQQQKPHAQAQATSVTSKGLGSAATSSTTGRGGGPRKKTNMATYHRRASNERIGGGGPGRGPPANRGGGRGGRGQGAGGRGASQQQQRRRPSSGPPSRQPSTAGSRRGSSGGNIDNHPPPTPNEEAAAGGAAMAHLTELEDDLLAKEKEREHRQNAAAAAVGAVGVVGAYRVPPSSGLTAPPDATAAGASSSMSMSYSRRASSSFSASDQQNRRSSSGRRLSSHLQEQAPRSAHAQQNRRASNDTTGQHSHQSHQSHDPEMATIYTGSSGGHHSGGDGGGDHGYSDHAAGTVTAVAVPVHDDHNDTAKRKGAGSGDDGVWLSGKKLRLLIVGLALLVIGLGAGVGIALGKSGGGGDDSSSMSSSSSNGMGMEMDGGGDDHGDHGDDHGHDDGHGHEDSGGHTGAGDHMDHSMGQVDTTSKLVELASIDGMKREGEFGTSISLSESGQRIAVSSGGYWQGREAGELFPRRGILQVYSDSDGDGKWDLLGDEIKTSAQDDRNDVADERNIPLPVQRNIYVVEMSRDGQRVAVGSAFHDVNYNSKNVGMVEIYALNERAGLWERLGQPILGSSAGDYSGAAVSLSYDGNIVAIGSPGHDGSGGPDCGQLRMYRYNDSTDRWSKIGSNIDGEGSYDMIGGSVSLSADGSIVAVAGTSKHGSRDSVILRVYENKNGQWSQQGTGIKDPLASGLFDMGWSISLSAGGTVLVCSNYYIGSEGHIDSANANDGHTHDGDAGDEGLYVQSFHLMNGEWTAMGGNMHSHTMGPRSGYVVSISDDGRTIGMGDPGRAGNGKASGHAHVYRYHGSMWHHSHEDHWMIVEGDVLGMAAGDAFGHTVALSRNSRRFAVGAPYNRNQGFEHGRVRIFDIVDI